VMIREDVTKVLSYAQFEMAPSDLPQMPDIFTNLDMASLPPADNPLGLVTTRLPQLQVIDAGPDDDLGEDPSEWEGKVSRNADCPCGSGKKYKHCHGAL
jgi:preprotein translocase subunit SecA